MTRLFLAAGVAALAIATPASAGPHGGGKPDHGGGGGGQRAEAAHGGGGGGGGLQRAEHGNRGGENGGFAVQRAERAHGGRFEQPKHVERAQARPERFQMRAERRQVHENRVAKAQSRAFERQQVRSERVQQAQQFRNDRSQRIAEREQLEANRIALRGAGNRGRGYGVGGCPPGLADKGCMPPGQAAKLGPAAITAANVAALREARVEALNRDLGTRLLAPVTAAALLGTPLNQAMAIARLNPLPSAVSGLYPDTPNYYYRYGDGYLYQVDRGSNLISSLLPLLGGGYMPGQYLPASYMNSYVPDNYGLKSFYPASYDNGYGSPYGYQNLCNRYYNGVVYQVDCGSGMVENLIPTYAGGYGVGQLLPSAYSTYNVPNQYRSLYYDTPQSNYWYAPGAIYQYDPSSSLITSVAALLSPGFSVGQQLPPGYNTYNVPYDYRSTYYDTPNAWYRYNNGNIYQVDPATQMVTAIVASLLT